jgi:hypothetical protein
MTDTHRVLLWDYLSVRRICETFKNVHCNLLIIFRASRETTLHVSKCKVVAVSPNPSFSLSFFLFFVSY